MAAYLVVLTRERYCSQVGYSLSREVSIWWWWLSCCYCVIPFYLVQKLCQKLNFSENALWTKITALYVFVWISLKYICHSNLSSSVNKMVRKMYNLPLQCQSAERIKNQCSTICLLQQLCNKSLQMVSSWDLCTVDIS